MGEMKTFPLQSGRRQGCPLSPLIFTIVLKLLSRLIRKEKVMKVIQVGKEVTKISLFEGDIILY
jgi:hypothetical protein